MNFKVGVYLRQRPIGIRNWIYNRYCPCNSMHAESELINNWYYNILPRNRSNRIYRLRFKIELAQNIGFGIYKENTN